MAQRQRTGQQGEALAAAYLRERGYQIVTQNWRCQVGEVDIIARTSETLVFVEVRTRRGDKYGPPEASLTTAKQARLVELAQSYLQETGNQAAPWRIDVVAVQLARAAPQINHIENAIGW